MFDEELACSGKTSVCDSSLQQLRVVRVRVEVRVRVRVGRLEQGLGVPLLPAAVPRG